VSRDLQGFSSYGLLELALFARVGLNGVLDKFLWPNDVSGIPSQQGTIWMTAGLPLWQGQSQSFRLFIAKTQALSGPFHVAEDKRLTEKF
jgi:hypothetical protein